MSSSVLQRLYGLLATPLFALLIFVLVCPLVMLGPSRELRRRTGRWGVRLSLLAIGVPLRVEGRQHLPPTPCIVISNHASYIDGLVLTAALPTRFTFVVQDGVETWPWIGPTLRRMGVRFVNRNSAREGAAQTRSLIREVQDDRASLAIFAEGTFDDEPGLLAFKKGAFLIAGRAGVPVVPVAIRGTRRFFGGGRLMPCWTPLEVEIAPALPISGDAESLCRDARAAVLARCGEPDRAPATPSVAGVTP